MLALDIRDDRDVQSVAFTVPEKGEVGEVKPSAITASV